MKEEILKILKKSDSFVSGQGLAESFGVSRTAVWKGIQSLQKDGYEILSVRNKGYKLIMTPDHLNREAISEKLHTSVIGNDMAVLDTVDSTNNFAKAKALEGKKSGFVCISREQTLGKGRLGRSWQNKKDESIALSVLLRPQVSPAEVGAVTPLAGLATANAIKSVTGTDAKIKWPNDIIFNNKKICGILTEMSCEFDKVDFIVIGIGINCLNREFPEDIGKKASSLYLITKEELDQNALAAEVMNELEKVLLPNGYRFSENTLSQYKSKCATLGRRIKYIRNNREQTGVAEDINSLGELIVKKDGGEKEIVYSGEVTIQGIY